LKTETYTGPYNYREYIDHLVGEKKLIPKKVVLLIIKKELAHYHPEDPKAKDVITALNLLLTVIEGM
jgi:hypothetical protein